jgi:hypothetical protein
MKIDSNLRRWAVVPISVCTEENLPRLQMIAEQLAIVIVRDEDLSATVDLIRKTRDEYIAKQVAPSH